VGVRAEGGHMNKARLISLLVLAAMFAMVFAAGHGFHHPGFRPGGMNDGGYW
jgi:hypothetical protein